MLIVLFLISCSLLPRSQEAPTTLTLLYNEKEGMPFSEDWLILEEYRTRRNVIFDVRTGDDSDYERVIQQTLTSGNIPDIVLKVWPSTAERYAADGLLLPFSDYEDQMPHMQAYIADHGLQAKLDSLRLDNGKYYILPGFQREIQVQQWIYRRDLFEKHGLGSPDTYDDLYNALATLKAHYPDSTPLTASWGGAHLLAMMGAGYEIPAGWAGHRAYDAGADRWNFAPATENHHELLRFLARCYAAEILDPETFTQDFDAYLAKLQDGRGLVTVTWITSGFANWNQALAENGVEGGEWAPMPVPESTWGVRALPPVDWYRKGLVVPARAANEPYFETLLAFLDWTVYSEEGMTLTTWGVEGTTYEETPEGKRFMPDIQTPKNPDGTLDITEAYGLETLFNLNENAAYEDFKKPPAIVAFLESSLEANETASFPPNLTLDADAIEAAAIIEERLAPRTQDAQLAFITSESDIDDDWPDFLAELEQLGLSTLEGIWNTAWQQQTSR